MKSPPDKNLASDSRIQLFNSKKLIKVKQPIKNYVFYLDINNSNVSKKIEQLILKLGGTVTFFWHNNITHFVTDKTTKNDFEVTIASNSSQAIERDVSNYLISNSSVSNDIRVKSKTRADAMLNRARRSADYHNKVNFLSLATKLGIHIWHSNFTFRYLKKINFEAYNFLYGTHVDFDSRIYLTKNFIKIETIQSQYRPIYHVLVQLNWPSFRVHNSLQLSVTFDTNQIGNTNNKELSSKLKTQTLDMTRKSRSSKRNSHPNSSEKQCGFCEICKVEYDALKIHLQSEEHICFVNNESNFIVLDSIINSSSSAAKFLASPESSVINISKVHNQYFDDNTKHIQRQTRQGSKHKNNLLEDKLQYIPPGNIQTKSNQRENMKEADSSPIRRGLPQSLIYKVIQTRQSCEVTSKASRNIFSDKQGMEEPPSLIVKFKKIRQTELSILSGEAENFMFPKKLSSEITDDDRQTTSDIVRISSDIASNNDVDQINYDNFIVNKGNQCNKKRKINETDVVQKRNRLLSPRGEKNAHLNRTQDPNNKKVVSQRLSNQFHKSSFAFERIPYNETWFEVFHRQDDAKEHFFEFYGNTDYRKLPYEMGPLAPTEIVKGSMQPMTEAIHKSINSDKCSSPLMEPSSFSKQPRARSLLKKKMINIEAPRKSPREHASTLAIISCLLQQNNDKSKSTLSKYYTSEQHSSDETIIPSDFRAKCDLSWKTANDFTTSKNTYVLSSSEYMKYNDYSTKMSGHDKSCQTYICPRQKEKEVELYLQNSNPNNNMFTPCVGFETEESDCNMLFSPASLTDVLFESILDKYSSGYDQSKKYNYLSNYGVSKKRRNNKTGWPIKKRITSKQSIKLGKHNFKLTHRPEGHRLYLHKRKNSDDNKCVDIGASKPCPGSTDTLDTIEQDKLIVTTELSDLSSTNNISEITDNRTISAMFKRRIQCISETNTSMSLRRMHTEKRIRCRRR